MMVGGRRVLFQRGAEQPELSRKLNVERNGIGKKKKNTGIWLEQLKRWCCIIENNAVEKRF